MTHATTLHDTISASPQDENTLRLLALKAEGMTGADIERLVREARQLARQQNRQVSWQDLEQLIGQGQPTLTSAERWLRAVHEAGHAVLHHVANFGDAIRLSIEGSTGPAFHLQLNRPMLSQTDYVALLAILLAGRAAEELMLGEITVGSGGSTHSDLARATDIAMQMESTRGFAWHRPLLYRESGKALKVEQEDSAFADRVNHRLERSFEIALYALKENKHMHEVLAEELYQRGVLEGHQVKAIIAEAASVQEEQTDEETKDSEAQPQV